MGQPTPDSAVELAGFGRRLASLSYESLLLLGVLAAGFMLPQIALGMGFAILLPGWVLGVHIFILLGVYFVWYWHHGGQTLAMQTWKTRVSTPEGRSPTLARLTLRYVCAWPSLACAGIGLIWVLFDRDRQFLHDRLAGTRLILKKN